MPEFIELKNFRQKVQIYILWIIQCGGIATDSMATKFQLGSADSEHIDSSDRLAV